MVQGAPRCEKPAHDRMIRDGAGLRQSEISTLSWLLVFSLIKKKMGPLVTGHSDEASLDNEH